MCIFKSNVAGVLFKFISLCLYLIPLTYIIFKTNWSKSPEEFDVAKRTLPAALVFASIAATFVGPGFSMGFVGKGYSSGFAFWIYRIIQSIFSPPFLSRFKPFILDTLSRQKQILILYLFM
jgi:Na+/proline symporter